jgi:antitoxin CcdA
MGTIFDIAIDPELLAEARRLGIDVEREIDLRLRESVERRKRQLAWREENREAIEAWNQEIEDHGLWYERLDRP